MFKISTVPTTLFLLSEQDVAVIAPALLTRVCAITDEIAEDGDNHWQNEFKIARRERLRDLYYDVFDKAVTEWDAHNKAEAEKEVDGI